MKSISNLFSEKIKSASMYKIQGGRYQKTGCGVRDLGGGLKAIYNCDIVDDEGKKPTYYFG